MTVIAAFMVNNVPIIFADTLVSGLQTTGLPTLPSGHPANYKDKENAQITDKFSLIQKITTIDKKCAIACAGDGSTAKDTIKDLIKLAKSKSLNLTVLKDFFDSRRSMISSCAFVGFVKDGDIYKTFHFNAYHTLTEEFGWIQYAGTGSEDLQLLLISDFASSSTDDEFTPEQVAITKGATLFSQLLAKESLTGENLSKKYGGAYEVATIVDGIPKKSFNNKHMTAFANITESSVKIIPVTAYISEYYEDILTVYSMPFSSNITPSHYIIDPLDRNTDLEERNMLQAIHRFSLNNGDMLGYSQLAFITVYVPGNGGILGTCTAVLFEPFSNMFLTQEYDSINRTFEIKLSNKFENQLSDFVNEYKQSKSL